MQNNGWSFGVARRGGGDTKVRYYIVAIDDQAQAVRAVAATIAAGQTIVARTHVEGRFLARRRMSPGEVRILGKP
jgi:hypothetical protein